MANHDEMVPKGAPKMVLTVGRAPDGSESYQWNVPGAIPPLTIIDLICQAQHLLLSGEWVPECDDPVFAVVWDPADNSGRFILGASVPRQPLVGMLEVVKGALVSARLCQMADRMAGAAPRVVGPDGRPFGG